MHIKCRYIPPPNALHYAAFRLYTYICICNCVCVCVQLHLIFVCIYLCVGVLVESALLCRRYPHPRLHVRIVNITKAACGAASFYVYACLWRCAYVCVCACVWFFYLHLHY